MKWNNASASSHSPTDKLISVRLATASLVLAVLGWVIYLLQWCFDLTLGLLLAAATVGMSAILSTFFDILPFLLWLIGIITGHLSLARSGRAGASGINRTIWALVLNYLGFFLTLLFFILIIILIVNGVQSGWFEKVLPFIHK